MPACGGVRPAQAAGSAELLDLAGPLYLHPQPNPLNQAMFLPVVYSLARTFRETVITRKVDP